MLNLTGYGKMQIKTSMRYYFTPTRISSKLTRSLLVMLHIRDSYIAGGKVSGTVTGKQFSSVLEVEIYGSDAVV